MKLHFEDNIAFIILTIALQGSGTEDKHNNNDVILLSAKFNFQGKPCQIMWKVYCIFLVMLDWTRVPYKKVIHVQVGQRKMKFVWQLERVKRVLK